MDSLTQIVLGAAVGEAMLSRKLGNKAMLLGAIGGTVPDLDVLYNLYNSDPIAHLVVHRSYTHSVFMQAIYTLPFVWASLKWIKSDIRWQTWYMFWFLCFFTHSLLDCCTTYGTQLFMPFTNRQIGFNNISVVDPLYTIPFLVLLGSCLFFHRASSKRRSLFRAAIIVSSAYMLFSFIAKGIATKVYIDNLQENHIKYDKLITTPSLLNTILWSATAINKDTLYVGEYSLLKNDSDIQWAKFPRNLDYENGFSCYELEVLKWFSNSYYALGKKGNDTLVFYNAKWGRASFESQDPDKTFLFNTLIYQEQGMTKHKMTDIETFDRKKLLTDLFNRMGL